MRSILNGLLPVRWSKRVPNPSTVALAAVVISFLRVLLRGLCVRCRLVGSLRLAAGLRAASLLAASHGQTASAEAVQGHSDRVAAGEGVLEVAHVGCVFSYLSFLIFWELGLGVSWTVRRGNVSCCCWRENVWTCWWAV